MDLHLKESNRELFMAGGGTKEGWVNKILSE
jgi:hypothetical protein